MTTEGRKKRAALNARPDPVSHHPSKAGPATGAKRNRKENGDPDHGDADRSPGTACRDAAKHKGLRTDHMVVAYIMTAKARPASYAPQGLPDPACR